MVDLIAAPDLAKLYTDNGLFAKIIDTPAEEATRRGFEMEASDNRTTEFCSEEMERLAWDEAATTAIKWARLFGGALCVILIDDGGDFADPVDLQGIRGIAGIRVYESSVVRPAFGDTEDPADPPRFQVFSKAGAFTVHRSRCLVFRNNTVPEGSREEKHILWGVSEYERMSGEIFNAEHTSGAAVKLLTRSTQGIYKAKQLPALLSAEDGEQQLSRRIEALDLMRGMFQTVAVDQEESYDFAAADFAGLKDTVNASLSILSAVSRIPPQILYGTPESHGLNSWTFRDGRRQYSMTARELWQAYIAKIQHSMLKGNARRLASLILQAGMNTGELIKTTRDIKVNFPPIWEARNREDIKLAEAKAQLARAKTAAEYVKNGVLTPQEVRRILSANGTK